MNFLRNPPEAHESPRSALFPPSAQFPHWNPSYCRPQQELFQICKYHKIAGDFWSIIINQGRSISRRKSNVKAVPEFLIHSPSASRPPAVCHTHTYWPRPAPDISNCRRPASLPQTQPPRANATGPQNSGQAGYLHQHSSQ